MSEEMTGQDAPVVANEAQNPAATPENVATQPAVTEAPEGESTQAETKSFTQEELDAIIQKEKAKAEAKAERRALKAYRETLERLVPQQQTQPQPQGNDRPTQAQFANVDDYVEAMADWKLSQRDQASRQQQEQQQVKSITEKTEGYYAEAQKDPSFDREAFDELPLTKTIAEAIIESDAAPKLMVFMANNPEEVQRIASLSAARQAAEIGKLEAKLASAPKPSNAPSPIKPIGTRGSATNSDASKMTMEEYAEFRRKQGARWAL